MVIDWDVIRNEYETTTISLADLAEKHGIKYPTVKSRNQRQGWHKDASKDASTKQTDASDKKKDASKKNQPWKEGKPWGAPKGSKNALGNKGGPGGPSGNKKAVKTGEHEAIWMDTLDDDERALVAQIDTDPIMQAGQTIELLTIRERRMMTRIQKLKNGLTEKQRRVLHELRTVKDAISVYDEKTATTKTVIVPRHDLVISEIEETEYRPIDDIIRLEEALTRVQDKKVKALGLLAKLLSESEQFNLILRERELQVEKLQAELEKIKNPTQEVDLSDYVKALKPTAEEVWADETTDGDDTTDKDESEADD